VACKGRDEQLGTSDLDFPAPMAMRESYYRGINNDITTEGKTEASK